MAQPIRKKIQEEHSDLMKNEKTLTLLVDGNSLMFNCMKDDKKNEQEEHYGGIYQFLLQLKIQMEKGDFDYVYVTFDDEFSGYLRWKEYNKYKANRDKHYNEYGESDYMKQLNANLKSMNNYFFIKNIKKKDTKSDWDKLIDENFIRERDILCNIFNELYIRWYIDEIVEGDDLIAYYVKHKKVNEKIVIISSDMDLTQLISDDVCIYNQHLKKYITNKNFITYFDYYYENTLVNKIFCGDTSDNIGNIKGLSEKKLLEIMPELASKKVTVEDVKERVKELITERKNAGKKALQVHNNILNGISNKEYDGDFYEINRKIIDLSEPLMTDAAKEEMDSMMYAPQDTDGRSFENIYKIALSLGINEWNNDTKFTSFFRAFKRLTEKEIKYYKESVGIKQ